MSEEVVRLLKGTEYTGNPTTFLADFGGTFVSNTGGTLAFTLNGDPFTITSGQWFGWSLDNGTVQSFGVFPAATWVQQWGGYASQAELSALAGQVSGLAPSDPIVKMGTAPVGPVVGFDTDVVAVELRTAMPDDVYSADAVVLTSVGLLGKLEVDEVDVVDENTVNVTIRNTGALSLSGAIIVTAIHK